MPANQMVVMEMRRLQTQIQSAEVRIRSARTIDEVVRAHRIAVPAWVRALLRSEITRLNQHAERKAEELLSAQLESLASLTGDDRKAALARLRPQWESLRGNFPRLATQAFRELGH